MEAPVAVVLLALVVLLDLAALKWGADSREGLQRHQGRFSAMINPFFTELHGRHRQEQLLAEAVHDDLLRRARQASPDASAGTRPLRAALGAPLVSVLRSVAGAAGVTLVAVGSRLQRVALDSINPDAADLEPAG